MPSFHWFIENKKGNYTDLIDIYIYDILIKPFQRRSRCPCGDVLYFCWLEPLLQCADCDELKPRLLINKLKEVASADLFKEAVDILSRGESFWTWEDKNDYSAMDFSTFCSLRGNTISCLCGTPHGDSYDGNPSYQDAQMVDRSWEFIVSSHPIRPPFLLLWHNVSYDHNIVQCFLLS